MHTRGASLLVQFHRPPSGMPLSVITVGGWPGLWFLILLAPAVRRLPHPSRAFCEKSGRQNIFAPRTEQYRVSSIAARPCKERKDGAPNWATRGLPEIWAGLGDYLLLHLHAARNGIHFQVCWMFGGR
jgi:hypothetical protein